VNYAEKARLVAVQDIALVGRVFEYFARREVARGSHRLRGSELSQYRRVLAKSIRHVFDYGRSLHEELRVLQCENWPSWGA
jgi:hypothetical protein